MKKKAHPKYENFTGLLFVLPALFPLTIFWIGPVLYSVGLSFTDWDMISPKINFVGLKNYISLLGQNDFAKVLLNTLVFAAGSLIPTILFGLLAALSLNGVKRGGNIYRGILFIPFITPMVAVSIVWSWIFEPRVGVLNFLLHLIHMPGLEWTQNKDTAMLSVIIVTVWKQVGWTMIFYMEALRKVPKNLLEAAKMDGAGAVRCFFNITMPMISPTTLFLFLITTINSMQAYDQIQVLTQGGPAGATRTLLYYYYLEAFDSFHTGNASAVAVVLVLLTVILSIAEMKASKKLVYYE